MNNSDSESYNSSFEDSNLNSHSHHDKQAYNVAHILKEFKHSKSRSDKKSLLSVKDAIHLQAQKNLEARLQMTQNQLTKAKENTLLLMEKLGEAENQIEELRIQLENERINNRNNANRYNQEEVVIEDMYERGTREKNWGREQERQKEMYDSPEKENEYKDMIEELEKLHKICENKDFEISKLLMKIKGLGLDNQKLSSDLRIVEEQKDELQDKLRIFQKTINKKILEQKSKGVEIIEFQQLSNAVERLIHLLKSTEEYKHFALFAEDAKGIHFLKNIPKKLKNSNILSIPPKKVKLCSCMELKIDEKLIWTPEESYKIMQEIKLKYDLLNQESIEQILFSLNQIWLSREQCHLKRVKEHYESQIKKHKKRNEERYDEVVARKQIERLKKEVSKAKNQPDKGMVRIDNLKIAGQYQDELRLKQKEIKLLQQKVKIIEHQFNNYDKINYMEGALWIIDKILKELDNYEENLKQFENNFIEEINVSIPRDISSKINRNYKNFFENLNQLHEGLYQKVQLMQESTLKKLQMKRGKEGRETRQTSY